MVEDSGLACICCGEETSPNNRTLFFHRGSVVACSHGFAYRNGHGSCYENVLHEVLRRLDLYETATENGRVEPNVYRIPVGRVTR